MAIEIHRPELEALILERMQSGAFQTIEDALLEALKTSPSPSHAGQPRKSRTGADLIRAFQSSPYRELEIESERYRLPVRDIAF